MKKLLICCLTLHLFACAHSSRVQLIEEFLQQRSINSLILLHCVEETVDQDVVRISKTINGSFRGTIYHIDVSKDNFHQQLGWHMFCERYKTGIILNLECSGIEIVLDHLSENGYFNCSFNWLIFGGRNLEQASCLLSNQNINYDTNIMLVVGSEDPRDDRYQFFDVGGTLKHRGGKVIFTYLGCASTWKLLPTVVERKPDLREIELWAVLSTINQHQPRPFIEMLETYTWPKTYSAFVHSYRIVKLLQMKLKFKMKIILTEDWRFDLIGKNSSEGAVGQLQTRRTDFSIIPWGVTTERLPLCDFTVEIARGTFYTIFRHPKSLNDNNIFLLPFETLLWISLIIVLTIVALALAVSSVLNHRLERTSYNDLIIGQSLLGTLGMLCQQGFLSSTPIGSKKILIIVTMSFSFLLLQFYSTFFVGYQLITPPKTINTLEKLVDSNIKVSIEDLNYQRDFFTRTTEPIALRLYEEKIRPSKLGFVNLTIGIQLVKRGGHAFHCETSYVYTHVIDTFTEQEICELQEVQIYPHRAVHLPMVKGCPLRDLFKVNLQLLKENGLMAYNQARMYIRKPKCIKNSNKTEQIYLTDVLSAFVLLSIGLLVSVAVLALELIVHHHLRRWYHGRMLIVPKDYIWIN